MGGFIWAFIGPEGSGKSISMAAYALQHGAIIAKENGYPHYEAYCVANKPVIECFPPFQLHSTNRWRTQLLPEKVCHDTDNKGKLKLSNDFKVVDWMKYESATDKATIKNNVDFFEGYKNILILIDELQSWFDRFRQGSSLLRMFNGILAQRRRRNIGIMYTVQNFDWVPADMRFLTHYVTICKDLYWTPWGKEKKLERGEQLSLKTIDMKGFITGQEYATIDYRILHGKRIRPFYDSFGDASVVNDVYKFTQEREEIKLRLDGKYVDKNEEIDYMVKQAERMAEMETDNKAFLENLAAKGEITPSMVSDIGRRLRRSKGMNNE